MATYVLQITISEEKVKQFNNQGWRLCFASGIEHGSTTSYNVVATTKAIATNVIITWTDRYMIAASQDSFSNGVMFTAATTPVGIKFGDAYTLPQDWTNGTASPNAGAPEAGFLFVNHTDAAAAVVYRKVDGVPAPIYFSAKAPLPKGNEKLTPTKNVQVWFAANARTSTMVSSFDTEPLVIDMTGRTTAAYAYDKDWNPAVAK